MNRFLHHINRYSPLFMLVFAVVMLYHFAGEIGLTQSAIDRAIALGAAIYPALALFFWFLVILGFIYEAGMWPALFKRKWIMDILDRLTNKQKLEQLVGQDVAAEVIDADQLATDLKNRIIGQDQVCDDIATQIRRRMALTQRGKPVGIFLLAGPPGTGKTYLGKRLSIELKRKLLHFDMTQFSSAHAASQLFGSPRGFVGSDSYGKLTASLKDTSNAVVLLDEFEKAHEEVHKKFLTAWNDGFITEASDGKQISTVNAIFIVTTNAATEALTEISTRYKEDADEQRRLSVEALRQARFAPEVLNRIDRIFVFKSLVGLDVARVAALEIEAMIESYGLKVANGGIEASVLFNMMRRHDKLGINASARDLVRAIEEAISDSLIDAKQKNAKSIILLERNNQLVAEIAS